MARRLHRHIATLETKISAFCNGQPPMHTESQPPFGTYKPNFLQRAVISMTRKLPDSWLGRRLAFALRRLALLGRRRPIDISVFNRNMRIHPFANVCEKRVLFTPQFFDLAEREALARAIGENAVFIDIGANVGAYSLFVSDHAGGGCTILAIEPQPAVYDRLITNIRLNPGSGIKALSCAVSDRDGTVTLFLSADNQGEASIKYVNRAGGQGSSVDVPAKTLMSIAHAEGLTRIDALKLDVEGAEDLILAPFLRDAPPDLLPRMIILENASHRWQTDCVQLCLDNGYVKTAATRMNVILEHNR